MAFSVDALSSNAHARKLREHQVLILLPRWHRAHGDRCIRHAHSPRVREARRDVRALHLVEHDLGLEQGLADWELHRDRASRRPGCGLLRDQDSDAAVNATRRRRKAR